MSGIRIYRELKKLGYDRSINPVYRFLNKLEPEKILISRNATVKFETPFGAQASLISQHTSLQLEGL